MTISDTPLRKIQVDNRRLVGDKLRGAILGDAKLKRSTLREIYEYHIRTQRAIARLMTGQVLYDGDTIDE